MCPVLQIIPLSLMCLGDVFIRVCVCDRERKSLYVCVYMRVQAHMQASFTGEAIALPALGSSLLALEARQLSCLTPVLPCPIQVLRLGHHLVLFNREDVLVVLSLTLLSCCVVMQPLTGNLHARPCADVALERWFSESLVMHILQVGL